MTRIWFNRWFSVAFHYMNMIRNNPDGERFELYGTHPDIHHMSLQGCDHKEAEPVLEGMAYIEFCLDFCRRHQIDIFVPRLHMLSIVKHAPLFEAIGVRLMACKDEELLELLMEKHYFYEAIKDKGIVAIPDYAIVNTAEQFRDACESLRAKGHEVCFKPTNAEGGMGFRILVDKRDPLKELYGWVHMRMTFQEAYDVLSTVDRFETLMVSEYLSGHEYSIDCLATGEGELLAAVPRRKAAGRVYEMEDIPELTRIARAVAEQYCIPYVYNIQVKYNDGVPKLLEINPRMSGGLYITCLTGVNFPYYGIQAVRGKLARIPAPRLGIKASYYEQAISLNQTLPV